MVGDPHTAWSRAARSNPKGGGERSMILYTLLYSTLVMVKDEGGVRACRPLLSIEYMLNKYLIN